MFSCWRRLCRLPFSLSFSFVTGFATSIMHLPCGHVRCHCGSAAVAVALLVALAMFTPAAVATQNPTVQLFRRGRLLLVKPANPSGLEKKFAAQTTPSCEETACLSGEYIAASCTPTSNTVCAACDSSCNECYEAGNTACIMCASGFHDDKGTCVPAEHALC
jgi:hypothetical protein